jgi:hypothetical protein
MPMNHPVLAGRPEAGWSMAGPERGQPCGVKRHRRGIAPAPRLLARIPYGLVEGTGTGHGAIHA